MSAYLAMCLDMLTGALAILFLYAIRLYAESFTLLLYYLRKP